MCGTARSFTRFPLKIIEITPLVFKRSDEQRQSYYFLGAVNNINASTIGAVNNINASTIYMHI